MKYLKHKVYGHLFNLFKAFPVVNNRISFIIDSRESFKGNLDYIKKEFEKRGDFEFSFFYKDKLSLSSFKKLATSKYVFLNDNFFQSFNYGMLQELLRNSEDLLQVLMKLKCF